MQEVRDLASTMRELFESVRKVSADAAAEFQAEVSRAHDNASKLQALTKELKSANLEVEGLLGSAGSNFPPDEVAKPVKFAETEATTDVNGVTLNRSA